MPWAPVAPKGAGLRALARESESGAPWTLVGLPARRDEPVLDDREEEVAARVELVLLFGPRFRALGPNASSAAMKSLISGIPSAAYDSGSRLEVVNAWPVISGASKPALRSAEVSVRGRAGCARWASQAASASRILPGSSECQASPCQSTSQMTARPPGRSARRSSANASVKLGDVLEDLDTDRCVEACVRDGKVCRLAKVDRRIWQVRDLLLRKGEHLLAAIDAGHGALGTHLAGQLGQVKTEPAPHIENPLPRLGREALAHEGAAPDDIASAIGGFELLRDFAVELELRHVATGQAP